MERSGVSGEMIAALGLAVSFALAIAGSVVAKLKQWREGSFLAHFPKLKYIGLGHAATVTTGSLLIYCILCVRSLFENSSAHLILFPGAYILALAFSFLFCIASLAAHSIISLISARWRLPVLLVLCLLLCGILAAVELPRDTVFNLVYTLVPVTSHTVSVHAVTLTPAQINLIANVPVIVVAAISGHLFARRVLAGATNE